MHLLPRARPGGLDVPGERERAGAEVQRRDRLARHPQLIDHVTHARDVLEEEVRRIVEVDVRLRGAVDDELVAARHETVGPDDGAHPVGQPGRALLVHSDIVSLVVAAVLRDARYAGSSAGGVGLAEVVARQHVRIGRHRRQELVEVGDREPSGLVDVEGVALVVPVERPVDERDDEFDDHVDVLGEVRDDPRCRSGWT